MSLTALQDAVSAILQRLEALEKGVKAAKAAASDVRAVDEIVNGVQLPDTDWRASYHGAEIAIRPCDRDKAGKLALLEGDSVPVLLALPRDSDVGGQGSAARSAGKLAVHWERTEQGSYRGQPLYVTTAELGEIWAD